jgi:hypothetical protein
LAGETRGGKLGFLEKRIPIVACNDDGSSSEMALQRPGVSSVLSYAVSVSFVLIWIIVFAHTKSAFFLLGAWPIFGCCYVV